MPLPKPNKGETQSAFVSRCIEAETKASPGKDRKQVQAMCYQAWRDRKSESLVMCPGMNPPNMKESVPNEPVRLVEDVTLEGAMFVEAANGQPRMIKNLRMVGQVSKHGYSYKPESLKAAVEAGLYEGVRLFVDHSEKNQGRSLMDLAGSFKNAQFKDGSVRGDAVLLTDQWGDKVWQIGKEMPHAAGFSHVADGVLKREGGKLFVESIRKVLSVDLVTTPATTNNMFESVDGKEPKMEYKDITLEALRTARPDIVSGLVEEGAKGRDEEVNKLMTEKADLEKKVDDFQVKEAAIQHAADVDKLLSESKLPDKAKTDVFRNSLMRLDGGDWKKEAEVMIEDRRKLFSGVKGMGEITNLSENTGEDVDDKAFQTALHS